MTFSVSVAPSVRDRIASWGLEPSITRDFYLRLDDQLSASSAISAVRMTDRGMEYTASVEVSAGVHYVFVALLRRTDESFQVIDCACVRIEGDTITWRSPRSDD